MLTVFRNWRRRRVLAAGALDSDAWAAAMARYPFTRRLSESDRARLRELVILFLDQKTVSGAGGFEVRDEVRIAIAVQACMLVLNLDLDCYRGWVEIIVYPDEFVVEYDYEDEAGVVHHVREPMTGESWRQGPVILSWADTEAAGNGSGYNVVMHEFAHKLDMLNGDADGLPVLSAEMDRESWTRTFQAAFEDFRARVERREETAIDPYAAESPSEFFAVLSEAFFEIPDRVAADYPGVYRQLAAFYRQDPAAGAEGAPATRAEAPPLE